MGCSCLADNGDPGAVPVDGVQSAARQALLTQTACRFHSALKLGGGAHKDAFLAWFDAEVLCDCQSLL